MSKNKVRFGIEQLHIAFMNAEGAWEEPVHIPGVVGFNANPDGNDSVFYADNIKYYQRQTNNGYTGDVEVALIPDEILAEMLGWSIDSNGMLVEDAEGIPKPFALMGQIQGDVKNRRFVYYKCTAGRPGNSHSTKSETVTPDTETAPLVIEPMVIGGKNIVKGVIEPNETNKVVYDAFFDEVLLPTEGGAS